MDDTLVKLKLTDIEVLEENDADLSTLIDTLTDELQHLPRVRPGRRFAPVSRLYDEVTVPRGRHRTWTPAGRW
jgi:hypothetical protein